MGQIFIPEEKDSQAVSNMVCHLADPTVKNFIDLPPIPVVPTPELATTAAGQGTVLSRPGGGIRLW